jgi:hypothetical protein
MRKGRRIDGKKMDVFCVVAPCSLVKITDVSEVPDASIIRAMSAPCILVEVD